MDRRYFLRLLALQAAAWSLGCGRHEGGTREGAVARVQGSVPTNPYSGRWMGDHFTLGHDLRDGQLPLLTGGTLQAATDVIVVGGGISGLTAAYQLAKAGRRVTVIEQAEEIGGNAKSAKWGSIDYSIGAAYFTRPDEGDPIETLYRELGVLDRAVQVPKGEALWSGKLVEGFWGGATTSGLAIDSTKVVADTLRSVFNDRYPDIPWTKETAGWTKAEFERVDRMPFSAYLDSIHAPTDVRRFCEYYCWSSFGGAATEISTYAALNFITAEFGDILALPGGNAGVAHSLATALKGAGVEIYTSHFVGAIRQNGLGVEVAALDGPAVRRFPAQACVVAVPRFVAKRIVEGFGEDRAALTAQMKWRAYLVANVLLSKRPKVEWYDAYRIDDLDPHDIGWTDLIVADFVAATKSEHCVLTAYRALPYDGGRFELLTNDDYPRHRDKVRRDLLPWLGALGLTESDIVDINLARWGHPLVLAQPGQLASGRLEALSRPLGRVTFAHQDRFGVPAIETAIQAGMAAAAEVG